MPKVARPAWFVPRQREGNDGEPRSISISHEALKGLFHLPLKDAAREVGLCATTFKKACRRLGLSKWPSRRGYAQTCAPAAPTRQTTAVHQAVTVACTSPVRHDASVAIDARSCVKTRHPGAAFQHKTFALLGAPSYIDTLTRGAICIGVPMPEGQPTTRPHAQGTPTQCGGEQGDSAPLVAGSLQERSCVERSCVQERSCVERSCVEAVMEYLDLGCSISEADVESMLSDDCSL